MTIRNRSESSPNHGETQIYSFGIPGSHVDWDEVKSDGTCQDVADSPGIDHAFTRVKYDSYGCEPINALVTTGNNAGSYTSNKLLYRSKAASHLSYKTLSTTSWSNAGSRTNPSRPNLVPLSLIQDLYDLPRMLKNIPRLIHKPKSLLTAKELANQNLATQFGWLPLVEDVRKLIQNQAIVEKRFRQLRDLYDNGGIRKKFFIDEDHRESVLNTAFTLDQILIGQILSVRICKTTEVQRWGTARWKLLFRPPQNPSYESLHRTAYRIANGLTVEGIVDGTWDLIPWSFLIDWYTGVGDFLSSHSMTVPCQLVSACQMTHTYSETDFTRLSTTSKWYSSGGGRASYETKERVPFSGISLSATVPALSPNQVSILGSLFIQRFQR